MRRSVLRGSEMGAGRNAAVREAKGEYLFFVDDHTLLLEPNAISVFLQVAQRVDADILTSAISFFLGSSSGSSDNILEHSRRPFLGGDAATGAFVNCFGSTNALVRRDAFEKIGGFSDEAVSTLDDWELFSKAALMGLRIETMPEVYVWHREDQDQESMVHSLVNAVRSARPYTMPGRKGRTGQIVQTLSGCAIQPGFWLSEMRAQERRSHEEARPCCDWLRRRLVKQPPRGRKSRLTKRI